jgi:hypothetical protein
MLLLLLLLHHPAVPRADTPTDQEPTRSPFSGKSAQREQAPRMSARRGRRKGRAGRPAAARPCGLACPLRQGRADKGAGGAGEERDGERARGAETEDLSAA